MQVELLEIKRSPSWAVHPNEIVGYVSFTDTEGAKLTVKLSMKTIQDIFEVVKEETIRNADEMATRTRYAIREAIDPGLLLESK